VGVWAYRRVGVSACGRIGVCGSMTRRPKPPRPQVHIGIAFRHHYVSQPVFEELDDACDKILSQIVKMIDHADRWVIQSQKTP
jgi:hypothetical protein